MTGGSSAINTSGFFRGDPEDFDHWAALGNDGWSFQEVLPFFRKMETDVDHHDDFHGTDGPIFVHHSHREDWHPAQAAFYNACRAAGFPIVRTTTVRTALGSDRASTTTTTGSASAQHWVTWHRPDTA